MCRICTLIIYIFTYLHVTEYMTKFGSFKRKSFETVNHQLLVDKINSVEFLSSNSLLDHVRRSSFICE